MTDNNSDDDVKIISTEDEKIKLIGEIFSNDSSRKILKLISDGTEMTANEIAQENKMSLTLATHHLKRMQAAGMVKITRTGKSVKGQDMKYYLATKQSFLIIPPEKTTHSIFESVRRFSKFAAIGMAGLVSWMILKPDGGEYQMQVIQDTVQIDTDTSGGAVADESWSSSSEDITITLEDQDLSVPEPQPEPSHSGVQDFEVKEYIDFSDSGSVSLDRSVYPEPFSLASADSVEPVIFSIIIPIAVIVGGIIIERLVSRWLRKRKINNQLN